MKRLIFYKFLIISTLFAACNKVELDPEDGEPVFTAEAKFDGNPKAWQAGVEDFYMFSSFEKDDFDVHVFSGSFTKTDSIVSGESLAFHIRDFQQVAQGNPDVNGALAHDFGFADMSGNDTSWIVLHNLFYHANFNSSNCIYPSGTQPSFQWDFGDGFGGNTIIDSISHLYDSNPDGVPVRLDLTTSNNGCSAYIVRNLNATNTSQNCDLDLNVIYNPAQGDSIIKIIAVPIGFQAFSYQWQDLTAESMFILDVQDAGPIDISVTVTGTSGCTVIGGISTTLIPGTIPQICIARYDYSINIEDSLVLEIDTIIYADNLQLSKITIVYTNAEGIQYRSDRQPQEPNATIKILEVDEYDANEKGEKTKKLTLEFTCRLWNEQGSFIDVTEGKAVIAVAYP